MGGVIGLLALVGLFMALGSSGCAAAHLDDDKDRMAFRDVSWGVVGVIGYIATLISLVHPVATKVLAVGIAVVTVHLVVKAIRVRLGCPLCPIIWAINAVIVVLAFLR